MGKGKGIYNKDCERSRQEKQQTKEKYGSQTAIKLRKNLTGVDQTEEIKSDCSKIFQNHYNACHSDFAKRSLVNNHKTIMMV